MAISESSHFFDYSMLLNSLLLSEPTGPDWSGFVDLGQWLLIWAVAYFVMYLVNKEWPGFLPGLTRQGQRLSTPLPWLLTLARKFFPSLTQQEQQNLSKLTLWLPIAAVFMIVFFVLRH